jgi:hypothetical protein
MPRNYITKTAKRLHKNSRHVSENAEASHHVGATLSRRVCVSSS